MIKCVLIGGRRDGSAITLAEALTCVTVPVIPAHLADYARPSEIPPVGPSITYDVYWRSDLRNGDTIHHVYLHDSLRGADIIALLIARYGRTKAD